MSKATVNQVIQRAISDAAFRRQLQRDPAGALKGFDLTGDERAAITSGDPSWLTSLGVDQRMSKAFVIGGLSGTASAVVTSDSGGAFNAALIDENVASATKSVIDLDPGHAAGGVIVGDPASPSVSAFDPTTASGDLNMIDAGGLGGTSAAIGTVVTDISQDSAWTTTDVGDGSAATAFELGPIATGDVNVLDAGPAEVDRALDVEIGTDPSAAGESGRDTGGDFRDTEF